MRRSPPWPSFIDSRPAYRRRWRSSSSEKNSTMAAFSSSGTTRSPAPKGRSWGWASQTCRARCCLLRTELSAHPAPDGTTALSLTPLEFLERLAQLIAPPRIHRHRYHGVLAPNARLRYQVIALGREQGTAQGSPSRQLGAQSAAGSSGAAPGRRPSSRWAALIARIYDVLPLVCTALVWCFHEHHRLRYGSCSPTRPPLLSRSPHPTPSTVSGSGAAAGHLRVRSDRWVRPRRSGTHS